MRNLRLRKSVCVCLNIPTKPVMYFDLQGLRRWHSIRGVLTKSERGDGEIEDTDEAEVMRYDDGEG